MICSFIMQRCFDHSDDYPPSAEGFSDRATMPKYRVGFGARVRPCHAAWMTPLGISVAIMMVLRNSQASDSTSSAYQRTRSQDAELHDYIGKS